MHPLSIRLHLLRKLPLLLALQAKGLRFPTIWVIHKEQDPGDFVPVQDMPPCLDEWMAHLEARKLTKMSEIRHHAIPFKTQEGGLLA